MTPVRALIFLLPVLIGCNSLKKLTGQTDAPDVVDPAPITSVPALGPAPDFGISVPAGMTRTVHYGELPIHGVVAIDDVPGSTVRVFIQERSIGQWFQLGHQVSGAFYYTRAGSLVTYHGANLSFKAYCIYQEAIQ